MESQGESRGADETVIQKDLRLQVFRAPEEDSDDHDFTGTEVDGHGSRPRRRRPVVRPSGGHKFGEDRSMASMTGIRRIVIATVVLAAASTVFGVIMLASRPMSTAMPGMDMSGMNMSGSTPTPTPTMDPDMPGMNMSGSTPTPTPTMDPDMPGMNMSSSTPTPTPTMDPDMPGMNMSGTSHDEHGATTGDGADRPLVPVLGTFGGGSAAVLLAAGILRRKNRATSSAKKAARAAGRAKK